MRRAPMLRHDALALIPRRISPFERYAASTTREVDGEPRQHVEAPREYASRSAYSDEFRLKIMARRAMSYWRCHS